MRYVSEQPCRDQKTVCRQKCGEIHLGTPVVVVLVPVASNLGFLWGTGSILGLLCLLPWEVFVPIRVWQALGG